MHVVHRLMVTRATSCQWLSVLPICWPRPVMMARWLCGIWCQDTSSATSTLPSLKAVPRIHVCMGSSLVHSNNQQLSYAAINDTVNTGVQWVGIWQSTRWSSCISVYTTRRPVYCCPADPGATYICGASSKVDNSWASFAGSVEFECTLCMQDCGRVS